MSRLYRLFREEMKAKAQNGKRGGRETMDRRIGRFSLAHQLIDRDPDAVQAVMARVIVVRCESMYATDTFDYVALSDDFEMVPAGRVLPEYEVHIKNGGRTIEFVQI